MKSPISELSFDLESAGTCIEWSLSGRYVAIGLVDGRLAYGKTEGARTKLTCLKAHEATITCLAWSEDVNGKAVLATGADDGMLKLWNIASGHEMKQNTVRIPCHPTGITSLVWLPDYLIGVASDDFVFVQSSLNGELVHKHSNFKTTVNHLHYSPGMKSLVAATQDALIVLHLKINRRSMMATTEDIYAQLEEKGKFLCSASTVLECSREVVLVGAMQEQRIMVWGMRSREMFQKLRLTGYNTYIEKVAICPRSRYIASTGSPGVVVWDLGTMHSHLKRGMLTEKICVGPQAMSTDVSFHPTLQLLVACFTDGHVLGWDVSQSGAKDHRGLELLMATYVFHSRTGDAKNITGAARKITWDRQGHILCVAFDDGHVRMWCFK